MIEEHLQRDGCEVYYVDGLHSRVVVATFSTPERAEAWLAVWQDHAALEAERDALAAKVARVEAVLADLYSHITGMYEMQDEWSDNWDDELSDIHATERWATALRAALADPAPDAAADDAALDELRQSWWPRVDAVLDALGEDMGVSDADEDGTRLCEICRERPGVGVVSDAGSSWFMCRECAASDWTAALPGGDEDEGGA